MGVSEKVGREDAVRLARSHYLALERIDMQSLASELGIGRTTLYRWVGDRESLISEVLVGLVKVSLRQSSEEAKGRRLDRIVDEMRRFMETTASFLPLRHLVQTEPELGLRVMIAPGSVVSTAIAEGLGQELTEASPSWSPGEALELAGDLTQIGMAYVWGNIATQSPPEIDRALRAMERMLRSAA